MSASNDSLDSRQGGSRSSRSPTRIDPHSDIEEEYVRDDGDNVTIILTNGQVMTIPISNIAINKNKIDKPISLRKQEMISDFFNLKYVKTIGSGTYGLVVKVKDENDKFYAVKIYKIDDFNMNGSLSEAYYGRLFKHPNIIEVLDFKINKRNAFLLMDFADADLSVMINDKKLTFEEKIDIMYQLAHGVDYVHRGGFAHCDLKPPNILMFNGVPKIIDTGIGRIAETGTIDDEQYKFVCQTVSYRSPEQYHNTEGAIYDSDEHPYLKWRNNDVAGEVWSLGIVCLEMLFDRTELLYSYKDYQKFIKKLVLEVDQQQGDMADSLYAEFIDLKKLNNQEMKLLRVICDHLLQLDPAKRGVRSFINDYYFVNIQQSIVPFNYPHTDNMYIPGGISIGQLQVITDWIGDLSKDLMLPPVIVANSIDYIIQHANQYHNRLKFQLFVIVVLFIMENIMNAKNATTNVDLYLYYTDRTYDEDDFMEMLSSIVNDGPFLFDGVYFHLINNNQVCRAILTMIYNLDTYIEYKTPEAYAEHIFLKHGVIGGKPKSNQVVDWKKLHNLIN